MAYLGTSTTFNDRRIKKIDDISSSFNGSSTAFTLNVDGAAIVPGSSHGINISLDGVWQEPIEAYSVNGSTITFTDPPAAGTRFFGTATVYGSDGTTVAPGAVIADSIASSAVVTNKLADGAVTAPKIAALAYLTESASVNAGAPPSTLNVDVKNNAFVYYTGNSTGTTIINIRGDSSTTLNTLLGTNQMVTAVVGLTNGATAYGVSVRVDGVNQTPRWLGNVAPSGGNANSIDLYNLTVLKTGASTYVVFASQSQYATG